MDDDTSNQGQPSADDALEPVDETIDDFRNQPVQAEDNDRPAAPAVDNPLDDDLPADHPVTDAELDEDEKYNQGVKEAADVNTSQSGDEATEKLLDQSG